MPSLTPTATGKNPRYDLTLSDGTNTVGLMLAGESPRALRRLPRGPGAERKRVAQNDWTGGRGNERLQTDASRFFDSSQLWTMTGGQMINGPLMRFSRLINSTLTIDSYTYWPGDYVSGSDPANLFTVLQPGVGSVARSIASKFVAVTGATATKRIWLPFRRVGGVNVVVTVELWTDSAGAPGALVGSGSSISTTNQPEFIWHMVELEINATLTAGNTYWLTLTVADNQTLSATNYWETAAVTSGQAIYQRSTQAGAWSQVISSGSIMSRIDTVQPSAQLARGCDAKFFFYKRQLYAAVNHSTGRALYLNGDRGVCTGAQAAGTIVDTTKAWATNEWRGCVVQIINGGQRGEYRKITSNTGTTLTLDRNWNATPTAGATGTEYVILGSEKWTVRSVTVAADITDVEVMNEIAYLALGDSTNVRRFREYNNAGVWTLDNADDGTNKATFLAVQTEGNKVFLYRTNNDTVTFSRAEKQAWGTNLTFDTAQPVGDNSFLITGLEIYDDAPHIGKENGIYRVANSIATLLPVPIDTAPDLNNGQRLRGWNTNLYFPFLDGWERLYGRTVDDIGPNRDYGYPDGRRGKVSDFVPVLQYGFVAWDGGDQAAQKSAVLATITPGGGWHELFGGAVANRRIRNLFYQNVPGQVNNKLWFSYGSDLAYLWMPNTAQNPLNDGYMLYHPFGYWVSSWIDFDTEELQHFFDELRLFSRSLSLGVSGEVDVDYQLDDATDASAWVNLGIFSTSPLQTRSFADTAKGRRLRLRLRSKVRDVRTPMVINKLELRGVQMNEVLYDYTIDFGAKDKAMLLTGADTAQTALAVINQLQAWQENATPLTMRCALYPLFDNVRGHIDPVALVNDSRDPANVRLQGSLTLKQV